MKWIVRIVLAALVAGVIAAIVMKRMERSHSEPFAAAPSIVEDAATAVTEAADGMLSNATNIEFQDVHDAMDDVIDDDAEIAEDATAEIG